MPRFFLILMLLAAGCAPPVTGPRPDGSAPRFAFWMENPPEFADLARDAGSEVRDIFREAGYELLELPAERAAAITARGLPPEIVMYPLGRAADADVICFGRLTPVPGREGRLLAMEFGLFDFRTGASIYRLDLKRVGFLRGPRFLLRWIGRWNTVSLLKGLEKIRRQHARPPGEDPGEKPEKPKNRAVIGVQMELADARKKTGVRLTCVFPGGPAAQAGVRAGDVLESAGGKPLRFPRELYDFMRERSIGERLKLSVLRGRQRLRFSMQAVGSLTLYERSRREMQGRPAPDFAFTLKGRRRMLSELGGGYVLVDFWSPISPHSLRGLMTAALLEKRWGKAGLAVISVALDDEKKVEPIEASGFITWARARDPDRALARRFRMRGLPARYLIGPDGKILCVDLSGPALDRLIRQKLEGKNL